VLSREMDLIWTILGTFGLKHLLVAQRATKAALKSEIRRELRATGWHHARCNGRNENFERSRNIRIHD